MTRRLLSTLALLATLAVGGAPLAQAQGLPIEGFKARVLNLMWWGDFDAVDRALAQAENDPRTDAQGHSAMVQFQAAMGIPGGPENAHPAMVAQWLRLTQAWAQSHPDRPLAQRLVAEAHLAAAWAERGGGYSNTVSEEGLRAFKAQVQAARAYLLERPDMLERSSQAHHVLLMVGMAQGWSAATRLKLVTDGLTRTPRDVALFNTALPGLLPKWGGNASDLDALVRLAVKHTEAEQGTQWYAKLYHQAAEKDYGQELFKASRANWATMKASFQSMVERHPASAEAVNHYAMYACLAQDPAAYREALGMITARGRDIEPKHWEALGGLRMVVGCQRWAGRA